MMRRATESNRYIQELNAINKTFQGGASSTPTTIHMYGGSEGKNLVIEGNVLASIKKNVYDWEALKKYVVSGDLPKETKNKIIVDSINDILNPPKYINSTGKLIMLIEQLLKLSDDEIVVVIENSLNIQFPYEMAMQSMFYVWKDLIEYLLHVATIKYNTLCRTHGVDQIIDYDDNIRQIHATLDKCNIESTSPLLFYLFPPKSAKCVELNDGELVHFKPNDKLPKRVNRVIERLNTYIKSREFEYLGFCPLEPKRRLMAIINFRVEFVVGLIRAMDDTFFTSNKVFDVMGSVRDAVIAVAKHKEICKKIMNKACIARDVHGEKLQDYVDTFVGLYKQTLPVLLEKEKKWIEIAKEIETITTATSRLFTI